MAGDQQAAAPSSTNGSQATESPDVPVDNVKVANPERQTPNKPVIETKIVNTVCAKNVLIVKVGTARQDMTLDIWFYLGSRQTLLFTNSEGSQLKEERVMLRLPYRFDWITDLVWTSEVQRRWEKTPGLDKEGKRRKVIRDSLIKLYNRMSRGVKREMTSTGLRAETNRVRNAKSWAHWVAEQSWE